MNIVDNNLKIVLENMRICTPRGYSNNILDYPLSEIVLGDDISNTYLQCVSPTGRHYITVVPNVIGLYSEFCTSSLSDNHDASDVIQYLKDCCNLNISEYMDSENFDVFFFTSGAPQAENSLVGSIYTFLIPYHKNKILEIKSFHFSLGENEVLLNENSESAEAIIDNMLDTIAFLD